jgi:hypothetical protein
MDASDSGNDHSSDEDFLPDNTASESSSVDYVLDGRHFSHNVFDDYTYSDMEYDTDDELAPYKNTRSGRNAPLDAAGTSSIPNPIPARQNKTRSHLSNPDAMPNKRQRTGGYLPPKKTQDIKGKAPQHPSSVSGMPVPPITPDPPVPDPPVPDPPVPDPPMPDPPVPGSSVPNPPVPPQPTMPDFHVREEVSSWEKQMLTPYVHAISHSRTALMPETLKSAQEEELDSYAAQFFHQETSQIDIERLRELRRHTKRRVFIAAQNACKYPPAICSSPHN